MPFNEDLPEEGTDPWYSPLASAWGALKTFVNGLETAIGLRALQTDLTNGLNGKANSSHTHDADAVTSGTFVTARIPELAQSKIIDLIADLALKADLIGGFVPTSQLPPIAITEFLGVVDSEGEMLLLTGQRGDWAIRSDVSSLAILTGEPSSTLGNWQLVEIGAGEAGVTSVNGQSGIVVLGYSDVGAASAAQGALAATAVQPEDLATVATSGSYSDLTDKPTLSSLGGVPTTRSVAAGTGLTGGGALSADQTLALSAGTQASLGKADSALQSDNTSITGVEWYATVEDLPDPGVEGVLYVVDVAVEP